MSSVIYKECVHGTLVEQRRSSAKYKDVQIVPCPPYCPDKMELQPMSLHDVANIDLHITRAGDEYSRWHGAATLAGVQVFSTTIQSTEPSSEALVILKHRFANALYRALMHTS